MLAGALGLCLTPSLAARPPYVAQIPFGRVNACANCHVNPQGGGARNPFGQAFSAANRVWTPELAAADSDGDGASNGIELQEPTGLWAPGAPETGQPGAVTRPGDPSSLPAAAPALPAASPVRLAGVIAAPASPGGEQIIGIFNSTPASIEAAGLTLTSSGGSWTIPEGFEGAVIPPQRALRVVIDGTRPPGGSPHINEPADAGLEPLDASSDFVALSAVSRPGAVIDYVQWGTPGQPGEALAAQAGQWIAGEAAPAPPPGTMLRHDGQGEGPAHWQVVTLGRN